MIFPPTIALAVRDLRGKGGGGEERRFRRTLRMTEKSVAIFGEKKKT